MAGLQVRGSGAEIGTYRGFVLTTLVYSPGKENGIRQKRFPFGLVLI